MFSRARLTKMAKITGSVLPLLMLAFSCQAVRYTPDWKSLDSRPLPSWYDQAKIGIFITWGVFSVPSFGSEHFWRFWKSGKEPYTTFMKENYPPDFTYPDFASQFTAEFYDPYQWADIFNSSGANYVVFVSKHIEGYTNWPSNYSWNWNSVDVGPKRDLVGELEQAIRQKTKIHFGVYHGMCDWFHPLYLRDKANGFKTQGFIKTKIMPELHEIVNRYKPDIVWSDADWMASEDYFMSKDFLAWLYNDSPVKDNVVVNDRWGNGTHCKHGGFWTCHDNYNPGKLQPHKWENCLKMDKLSWGYRRNAQLKDFRTMDELMAQLVSTISCGGNLLVNVGPTKYGEIAPIFEERLRQMGQWLGVNGEAVYGTHPWTFQNDTVTPNVWYTSKKSASGSTTVYAILLQWPKEPTLKLGAPTPTPTTRVTLIGYQGSPFAYQAAPGGGMVVTVPKIPFNQMPCQWGWVLKMEGLKNHEAFPPSREHLVRMTGGDGDGVVHFEV